MQSGFRWDTSISADVDASISRLFENTNNVRCNGIVIVPRKPSAGFTNKLVACVMVNLPIAMTPQNFS